VQAMRERIALINPSCVVRAIEEFVTPENWPALLPPGVDAVIDACDQARAKLAMAAWARAGRQLFISCGAAGGKRAAHKVEIEDLSLTTHDPLLAQLRYRLRKQNAALAKGKIGVACVFSREAVAPPDPSCAIEATSDSSLNCHGYGSSVSVTAAFGMCAAGWVMDKISSAADKNVSTIAERQKITL
jgi:tRNA threonylcarbamoyladenosine dehydratase